LSLVFLIASSASSPSWSVFDLPQQRQELAKLQEQAQAPDLWDDQKRAQGIMKRLSHLGSSLDAWTGLEKRIADALELAELGDESLRAELETEAGEIEAWWTRPSCAPCSPATMMRAMPC